MKNEFNLSDRIILNYPKGKKAEYYLLKVEDVKEFIRLLKEIFSIENSKTMTAFDIQEEIDKLAGEKLQ